MSAHTAGRGATVIGQLGLAGLAGLVALAASVGLTGCTYNFDQFAEQRDAAVVVGGSSGGAPSANGGSAGSTLPAGGAAGVPLMTGGLGQAGGTRDPGAAGGMEAGDVRSDGGGTGGRGTGGLGTGGLGTGGLGTGGTRLDGGGAGGGSGGASGSGGGTGQEPDLVLWYKFDESSGTNVADSAMFGGTARNASLATMGTGGSATFSTVRQVGTHAVTLTPATTSPVTNGGYVTVPALQPLAPSALTISVWVNLAANTVTENWERIFDFGTGSSATNFLYLVARAGSPSTNPVQFVISTKGHSAASGQSINSPSALTPNVWHHVAIVLPAGSPYTGTMYLDGIAVATNTAMTLHASDIGATTNNFLGRSQFNSKSSGDPMFNGSLDDFRVYRRALAQQEISDLIAIH